MVHHHGLLSGSRWVQNPMQFLMEGDMLIPQDIQDIAYDVPTT